MTVSRIDFADLGRGERVEPVVLIAGVPVVLTVGGTRPTAFAATGGGTFDALWWPGTFATITLPGAVSWDLVRDILDPRTVWTTRHVLDLAKGDVQVEPLPVDLLDRDSTATALLSRRNVAPAHLLAEEATDTSPALVCDATGGFASAGVAHVGREAIYYSSITGGTDLTITSRGKFGSKNAAHKVNPYRPPIVTSGALPRYLQGRRATVWLCRVSADGTTLYDPTLWHIGIVGAGVQLVAGGTRWQITLDSITEVLRTAPDVGVDLYGWQHARNQSPLLAHGVPSYSHEIGPETNGGWSPTFEAFKTSWNTAARIAAQPFELVLSNGNAAVKATVAGSFTLYAWLPPMTGAWEGPDGSFALQGAPDTCLLLDGTLYLSPDHWARIPTVLEYTVTDPAAGAARYTITADTDESEDVAAVILSADGTAKTVTVRASIEETDGAARAQALRITKRTAAKVGILAEGASTLGAVRALALAVDALGGTDDEAGAIDWDHLAATFRAVPLSSIPEQRAYRVGSSDDTLLTILADEARLRGCTLAVRRGRVTAIRAASFAASEAVGAVEITAGDVLVEGDPPRPMPVEVVDQPEAPITRLEFLLRDETTFAYQDDTFAAEFGTARAVECRALAHIPVGVFSLAGLSEAIGRHAQQILGVLAEPQRTVKIPLGPRFLGLEPGDIVVLTHDEVPSWDGSRGVTSAVCQVDMVERSAFGGSGRVIASLRLGETGLGGYAPAALVAGGGLSGGSTTVLLDTGSAFGASCFAPPGESPTYGFAASDVVVLSQYDAETVTVTEITRTLVAVDPAAHTLTLDAAPSAGMVTQAAATYGVVVRTAPWTAVTSDQQERSAFVADAATGAFSDSEPPKRWAA